MIHDWNKKQSVQRSRQFSNSNLFYPRKSAANISQFNTRSSRMSSAQAVDNSQQKRYQLFYRWQWVDAGVRQNFSDSQPGDGRTVSGRSQKPTRPTSIKPLPPRVVRLKVMVKAERA
jgi:hypothetical protein